MRAIWNGVVLAESDDTVVAEGNHYFPADSLHEEHLVPSERRTVCPWKGVASYRSVSVAGQAERDVAWEYERPSFLARKVKGRVAFGGGVEVLEAASSEGTS